MTKLSLWKKLIVVVCVLSTLLLSFVFSAGATGYSTSANGFMHPYFYPTSISLYNNSNSVNNAYYSVDMNTTVPWSFSTDVGGYGNTDLVTYSSGSDELSFSSSISLNSTNYSGYNVTYASGSITSELTDVTDYGLNIYRLYIDDVFLFGSLVNDINTSAFNWLGYWTVKDSSGNNISASRYRLRYKIRYVKNRSDGGYEIATKEYDYDTSVSVLSSCPNIGAQIRTNLRNDLTTVERSRGVYLEYCILQFYDVDVSKGLKISGQEKFLNEGATGYILAMENWKPYMGSTNVVSNQTPIGTIVSGLESIWNFNLFGSFTIGTLFSVAISIPLCIWLLKLFAGG